MTEPNRPAAPPFAHGPRPGIRLAIAEALRHLNGPSGGLSYHATALRYRRTRWAPFLRATKGWLESWAPIEKRLVIFGPSAGWTLPEGYLSSFDEVVAVEPDPAARMLLRKRNPGIKRLEFQARADLLPWLSAKKGAFAEFLERHQGHAILFSNLLGQIPLVLPAPLSEAQEQDARGEFIEALRGRTWASYHDLLSATNVPANMETFSLRDAPDLESLASRAFPAGAEAIDHGTLWLSKGRPTECAFWQIRPRVSHLIGFVRSP